MRNGETDRQEFHFYHGWMTSWLWAHRPPILKWWLIMSKHEKYINKIKFRSFLVCCIFTFHVVAIGLYWHFNVKLIIIFVPLLVWFSPISYIKMLPTNLSCRRSLKPIPPPNIPLLLTIQIVIKQMHCMSKTFLIPIGNLGAHISETECWKALLIMLILPSSTLEAHQANTHLASRLISICVYI